MKHIRKRIILGITVVAVFFAFLGYLNPQRVAYFRFPGSTIHTDYVFQDTFRGIARIVPNQPDGIFVPVIEGRYTFEFPHNGMLKIKGIDPRNTWEVRRYLFKSGRPIPEIRELSDLKPGIVKVSYYGDISDGTSILFVGDEEDADRIDWEKIW
jgi:hypothetical protein